MSRFVGYFVARHKLVHVIVAIVMALGWLQVSRAPRETFPNVTLPTLLVTGILPGASARDMETKVTIPIQEAIEELNGLKGFNTVVTDSSSISEVELYHEFDVDRVREAEQNLRALIDGVRDFPPEMEDDPVVERLRTQLFPVARIALAGPSESLATAGRLLERRLRKIGPVARVTVVGLSEAEVQILVDPLRARESRVTLLDIEEAVRNRNVSATGGILESETDRRQLLLWSRFESPVDVAETVLRFAPDGGLLRVSDVARVDEALEETGLITHTNGEPGLTIVVTKHEDADIIDTVDRIRAVLEQTALPDGISYSFVRDESFVIRNRLELMLTNGALGVILVGVVLFVFLRPVAAFWTMAGIPVVFLATLAALRALGFSINLVTLTALVVVLGMIVDDAIVVSERIVAHREAGRSREDASVGGASDLMRPVLAGACTTMLAFAPIWALGGVTGGLSAAIPAVVILALAFSVLECFTLLPAHMAMGSSFATPVKRRFMARWESSYRRTLNAALRHRGVLCGMFLAILLAVFGIIGPQTRLVLFPQDDSEAVYVKVTTPRGTPLERTEAIVSSLEAGIAERMKDDLTVVTARIGHQDPDAFERTRGAAENEAVIIAMVRRRGRAQTSAEWIDILEEDLVLPEGTEVIFEADFMGPPVGKPVTIHVATNDDARRRATAREIADWLRAVDGVTSVEVDERPGTPQVELQLDHERLALRGLDAGVVARSVQAAFQGVIASEHRDLDKTTEFRVMLDPSARRSLDSVLGLLVRSRTGRLVQLRSVVTPIEVPGVSRIYHRDGTRTATVSARFVAGAAHTAIAFADRIEREVLPRYRGMPSLEVTVGGEAVETRDATGDLGTVTFLACAGIAVVIFLILGSFLDAFIVVAVVPFALAAVLLAFFTHQQPLSLFAMLGSIGLAGVVVNDSILMIDAIQRGVAVAGDDRDERRQALVAAVVTRLRPVLATTFSTLGGVLPMAYGLGGYDAILAPMALALGWGLALSTLVTLVLVPVLYSVARDPRSLQLQARGFGPRARLAK